MKTSTKLRRIQQLINELQVHSHKEELLQLMKEQLHEDKYC